MDSNADVTNSEIVEYLSITYDILKNAKSSLDLDRLKIIIDTLKLDKQKKYPLRNKKQNPQYDKLIDIFEKCENNREMTEDELKMYNEFIENIPLISMAHNKNYNELYRLLNNKENKYTIEDLSVLYYCLYKEKAKQRKKTDLLKSILKYIEQNLYFDNMDIRYKKNYNNNQV